ncbi:MAG: hypothetical protein AB7Q37_05500 [Pyrinomonadaceae bacterium]
MQKTKILAFLITIAFAMGCGPDPSQNSNTANTGGNVNSEPDANRGTITIAERPAKIKEMMAARGEQDSAAPTLEIVSPAAGSTINSSTVKVRLKLGGDLKGYMPGMDPQTRMGNHIHVILDNQPYEAYYNLRREFELWNVADGEHTLRVFASRPWHESYKNEGSFQMVRFTVKGGKADASKPTTTSTGNTMADPASAANANAVPAPPPTEGPRPGIEGKKMQNSAAGQADPSKPLLTFSRPKGEYRDADADAIMVDFWLANAKLVGDGGDYRVRYSINGGEARFIDKWEPIWVSGVPAGRAFITLELVDKNGGQVDNGGYNSTTGYFMVLKAAPQN